MGLAASFASSLRDYAGLGVVIALAITVLLRSELVWPRRLGLLALLTAAYLFVTPFSIGFVERNAESWARDNGGVAEPPETPKSFLWHSAYIGIGWLPNDEGVTYSDLVGYFKAREKDQDVYPFTADYLEIMRGLSTSTQFAMLHSAISNWRRRRRLRCFMTTQGSCLR